MFAGAEELLVLQLSPPLEEEAKGAVSDLGSKPIPTAAQRFVAEQATSTRLAPSIGEAWPIPPPTFGGATAAVDDDEVAQAARVRPAAKRVAAMSAREKRGSCMASS